MVKMCQETAQCEFADCDVELNIMEMFDLDDIVSERIWVCPTCYEKVSNETGYCSISCQLGYGCDDSC